MFPTQFSPFSVEKKAEVFFSVQRNSTLTSRPAILDDVQSNFFGFWLEEAELVADTPPETKARIMPGIKMVPQSG